MLLASRSADRARRRLGYALSSRIRMGILSWPGPAGRRIESRHGAQMSRHSGKLPDLGEGTVAAEIVAWRVQVGDTVEEDQPVAEMSTDKAVVELPSPVRGKVVARNGEPGDVIPVGTELLVFEVDGAAAVEPAEAPAPVRASAPAAAPAAAAKKTSAPETSGVSTGEIGRA